MDDSEDRPRDTAQERNPVRYALIAVPVVLAGLALWYLITVFLMAPTIDGPAADEVQGAPTTTVEELSIGGDEIAPNDAGEATE